MPTYAYIKGFKFYIVMYDCTEPPHIHAESERGEAKFWLFPVALAENRGLNAHDLKKAEKIVTKERNAIANFWEQQCKNYLP